jgi:hypothetical protein
VLPILLGASIGQRARARPALIAAGFVASFAFVALALNAMANALHFDADRLRTAGLLSFMIARWHLKVHSRLGAHGCRSTFASVQIQFLNAAIPGSLSAFGRWTR